MKLSDAESQLTTFIDKFDSEHQTLIRAVRKALRERLPTATELAYDNYSLPDPKKILLGSGNQTRFIRLESADVLNAPRD